MPEKILIALLSLFAVNFEHASAQERPLQGDIERLQKINTFSIGLVGFVGRTSEGEIFYRKISKAKKAKTAFTNIIQSKSATNAAKIYAACGLRDLSQSSFTKETSSFKDKNEIVVVLRGDILSKEEVPSLLMQIQNFGCH